MTNRNVFINCPFTEDYNEFFQAIVFSVIRSGFSPRCARENDDGGEVRIEKICRIVSECRYGIHDISNTALDPGGNLPRFNMPLELGLFIGARKFGGRKHATKKRLILDRDQYRYQRYISDISGQDIHAHEGSVARLIEVIASWLRDEASDESAPGGRAIAEEFQKFSDGLPNIAASKRLSREELTFKDLANIAAAWVVAEDGSTHADA